MDRNYLNVTGPNRTKYNRSGFDHKRQRITMSTTTTTTTSTIPIIPTTVSVPISTPIHEEEKKPLAFDDSRRLFQRLWTDEDEIGLLQGFLEYTSQRGGFKNSAYHHDIAPFYDQIKSKLQLDFNKNQLVEKLRRLKKKFRNVMSRINSGKDFNFKTPHDQATFEISRKIWSGIAAETGWSLSLNLLCLCLCLRSEKATRRTMGVA
ncbi:hypothetical protein AQUCO_02600251v1 [Aquilegia coerulea]|uniref:Glabrous enhancer-binding protein-like DBD domain-containing protein n=1 Tax=Aquilegia coerulea TaxID=218851 RepID=A0A2G5D822_AQUCA|nr:hypothetical protein AQUCO_02600251v1 [Aquilegia coerulea]